MREVALSCFSDAVDLDPKEKMYKTAIEELELRNEKESASASV